MGRGGQEEPAGKTGITSDQKRGRECCELWAICHPVTWLKKKTRTYAKKNPAMLEQNEKKKKEKFILRPFFPPSPSIYTNLQRNVRQLKH